MWVPVFFGDGVVVVALSQIFFEQTNFALFEQDISCHCSKSFPVPWQSEHHWGERSFRFLRSCLVAPVTRWNPNSPTSKAGNLTKSSFPLFLAQKLSSTVLFSFRAGSCGSLSRALRRDGHPHSCAKRANLIFLWISKNDACKMFLHPPMSSRPRSICSTCPNVCTNSLDFSYRCTQTY